MAKKTPLITNNVLEVYDVEENERLIYSCDLTRAMDWDLWQQFLEDEKAFRYLWTNKQGFKFSFSAYKELRPSFGDKEKKLSVWIAHKRVEGKLRRVYLGKNDNLTAQKLQEVALKISQGQLF